METNPSQYIYVLRFHMWVESECRDLVSRIRYSRSCQHISDKFKTILKKLVSIHFKVKRIKIYGSRMKVGYIRDDKGKKKEYIYIDMTTPRVYEDTEAQRFIRTSEEYIYSSPELRNSIVRTDSLSDLRLD